MERSGQAQNPVTLTRNSSGTNLQGQVSNFATAQTAVLNGHRLSATAIPTQGETRELRGANSAPANGVRAGCTRRRYGSNTTNEAKETWRIAEEEGGEVASQRRAKKLLAETYQRKNDQQTASEQRAKGPDERPARRRAKSGKTPTKEQRLMFEEF